MGGGGGYFWQFLVLLTLFSDQKMSQLAYFSFFLTHLSNIDWNDSRSSRSCTKRHMPIWLQKGSTPLLGGKEHRSFFEKISVLPYVRESKTVLSSFDARDSVFRNICQWNMDTVSQSLVGFLIPWAVFRIPKLRIVDFTAKIQWLPNSTSRNFPDSWIQIALASLLTLP